MKYYLPTLLLFILSVNINAQSYKNQFNTHIDGVPMKYSTSKENVNYKKMKNKKYNTSDYRLVIENRNKKLSYKKQF